MREIHRIWASPSYSRNDWLRRTSVAEMSEQHFCLGELVCGSRIVNMGYALPPPLSQIGLLFLCYYLLYKMLIIDECVLAAYCIDTI